MYEVYKRDILSPLLIFFEDVSLDLRIILQHVLKNFVIRTWTRFTAVDKTVHKWKTAASAVTKLFCQ
jgi:hypothetical protein